jgi:hypothetical protein
MKAKVKNLTRGRKAQSQKIKSFNAPIIEHFKPKSRESGYQKLINHIGSGNSESARELLENAGYSGILADFLLDNAELDMRLQALGDMLAVGGSDE